MGFDPIILIGCDMSYGLPRVGADSDHFDPRYLDGGRSWEVPDVASMQAQLAAAWQACDAHGIRILNASAGGSLEVFPRVRYQDLLGNR